MKKVRFMDWPFLVILFFFIMGPLGTKFYLIYNHMLYNVPFNWMETQDKLTPQKKSEMFADKRGMQAPVTETVSTTSLSQQVGESLSQEDLSSFYANPVALNEESIKKGGDAFRIYCSVCHGDLAEGGNTAKLRGGHFLPPTLHSQKLKDAPDGLIYQIIMRGQNSMPSYAKQIPAEVRWSIVNYVRVLQRSQGAKESDLEVKVNEQTAASTSSNSGKEGHQ